MRWIFLIWSLTFVLGCVVSESASRRGVRSTNADLITTREMRTEPAGRAHHAYAVIRVLRPGWIMQRRRPVAAYVNGMRVGPLTRLSQVPKAAIRRIEYIHMGDVNRYASNLHDVVLVTTR